MSGSAFGAQERKAQSEVKIRHRPVSTSLSQRPSGRYVRIYIYIYMCVCVCVCGVCV